MREETFFRFLLWGWMLLALATFPLLLAITVPYGRHRRLGWGSALADKWGWVAMEAPASLGFVVCFAVADVPLTATMVLFLVLWEAHHFHRAADLSGSVTLFSRVSSV